MDIKLIKPWDESFDKGDGLPWDAEIDGKSGRTVRIKNFEHLVPEISVGKLALEADGTVLSYVPVSDAEAAEASNAWKKKHTLSMNDGVIEAPSGGELKGKLNMFHSWDDFRYCEFNDITFKNIDFSSVNFSYARFNNCTFKNVNFKSSKIVLTGFRSCNFVNCDFKDMVCCATVMDHSSFRYCKGKAQNTDSIYFRMGGATDSEYQHYVNRSVKALSGTATDKERLEEALYSAAYVKDEIKISDVAHEIGVNHMDNQDVIDICNNIRKSHPLKNAICFGNDGGSYFDTRSLFTHGILMDKAKRSLKVSRPAAGDKDRGRE